MADLVAGQQDYAGLKWRLVKTLRPGLAARLLTGVFGRTLTGETSNLNAIGNGTSFSPSAARSAVNRQRDS